MAKNSTIISGFGGQGVLFSGSVLAETGAALGKQVAYLPAYGPEARGGTSFCSTIISDEEILSPLVEKADSLIALNSTAAMRFVPMLKAGGTLLLNSSLVGEIPDPEHYHVYKLPAGQLAESIGSPKCLNMVCLGALFRLTNLAPLSIVSQTLHEMLSEEKLKLLKINLIALELGYNYF